jgi:hypothetical protein
MKAQNPKLKAHKISQANTSQADAFGELGYLNTGTSLEL